jgi:DNA-binding XRE family transcriptional regulator
VGEFFQSLATSAGLSSYRKSIQDRAYPVVEQKLRDILSNLDLASTKSVFGPAFKAVRLHYMVTQKAVAEKAKYNLRNLLDVESSRQEPGIMTALAMVCAVGADVGEYFSLLHELQKSFSAR